MAAAIGIVFLGAGAFLALGFMLASFLKTEEQATGVVQVVQMPLMFLSGIFFSFDFMPDFLRSVARLLPLTYLGDGLRQTMVNGTAVAPLSVDVLVLAGWAGGLSGDCRSLIPLGVEAGRRPGSPRTAFRRHEFERGKYRAEPAAPSDARRMSRSCAASAPWRPGTLADARQRKAPRPVSWSPISRSDRRASRRYIACGASTFSSSPIYPGIRRRFRRVQTD